MSVFRCLRGKVDAGLIKRDAAQRLEDVIREREQALGSARTAGSLNEIALEVADATSRASAIKADQLVRTVEAQLATLNVVKDYSARLTELRATPGDFGFGSKAPMMLANDSKSPLWPAIRSLFWRDPHEIATNNNVHYLAKTIRDEANAKLTDLMDALRPKMLGFKRETAHEFDLLSAAFDAPSAPPEARVLTISWSKVAKDLADQFRAAGGQLAERATWRLPNPTIDRTKIAAVSREQFIRDQRVMNDRADVKDFITGKAFDDAGFDRLMGEVYDNAVSNWTKDMPSAGGTGRSMLANSRTASRVISLKDQDQWMAFAQKYGTHDSPYDAMMNHIASMAEDIAMLRILGPNPDGLKRYINSLFDRELESMTVSAPDGADAATQVAALKANRAAQDNLNKNRKSFETAWAHVTGVADTPVNTAMAHMMGDMRSVLVSSQMGGAIISSLTDPGSLMMTARFNGIPAMGVISRATSAMFEKGSEIHAAQMGLAADSLAQAIHSIDRFSGETLRTGTAGQLATGTIRASGLRRWSSVLRQSFGLEAMGLYAREAGKTFGDLDPSLKDSLGRYGIDAADWDVIRSTPLHEERPNAFLLRPMDVRALGGEQAGRAADKLKRLIDTEMDYAVIEGDPMTRAMMYGDSRPGTVEGEARRAIGMYKSFPITFITTHFARAMARGWDGGRMGHAAISFAAMWALGIVAMQAKQVAGGRDPYTLDPATAHGQRALAAALLQGGGLGIFGDLIGADQTRYGNTFVSTLAGPQFAAVESVVGDFVMGNVQRAMRGEPTHFAGDALYTGARFVPGSSLWYARTTFQNGMIDQLALMIDPRAPERFRRIEAQAQKDYGQRFWMRRGEMTPSRAPDFGWGGS